MHELIIREAVRSDAAAIHAIHMASIRMLCASSYTAEEIHSWSSNPDAERYARQMHEGRLFLLAVEGENICGFGALDIAKQEIASLFVHPGHAGHGIGAELLRALETMATHQGLREITVHSSLNARRFYEKYGYGKGELEKFQLWSGLQINAIRLIKNLSHSKRQ
ncbi:MAG: GNAT family N-acetyltransferase [Gammaproteobacteria bacterium]